VFHDQHGNADLAQPANTFDQSLGFVLSFGLQY